MGPELNKRKQQGAPGLRDPRDMGQGGSRGAVEQSHPLWFLLHSDFKSNCPAVAVAFLFRQHRVT